MMIDLPAPVSPLKNGQPIFKADVQVVDNGKIFNQQLFEHDSALHCVLAVGRRNGLVNRSPS
jgi:3-keto-L-gulonate-6-phosphate decarboxylase